MPQLRNAFVRNKWYFAGRRLVGLIPSGITLERQNCRV